MKTRLNCIIFAICLAIAQSLSGQPPTADIYTKLDTVKGTSTEVNLLNDLAFRYFGFYNDSAKIVLDKAMDLSEKDQYIYGIARTLIGFAYFELTNENYPQSIFYLDEAMRYYDQIENKKLFGSGYNAYGIAYNELGEYDEALRYYQMAYDNLVEQGRDASPVLANIGIIYNKQFNFDKGLDYFKKALQGAEKNENPYQIIGIRESIATSYAEINAYHKAISQYHKVIALAKKVNLNETLALAYGNLGKAYYNAGKTDSAIIFLEKGIKLLRTLEKVKPLVNDLCKLSEIFTKTNKPVAAKELLEEAEKLTGELGTLDSKITMLETKAIYFENTGKDKMAIEAYKAAIELNDSLYAEKQNAAIAMLETKFNFRQQKKEIELLNFENKLHIAENKRQKQRVNFLVALGVLLLGIAILIYLQYRKTKQSNKQLTLKNLELMRAETKNNELKNSISTYADAHKDELLDKIENIMRQEKIFTNPKITIDEMAAKLNTNRSYLSQTINAHFKSNFKSFINNHRIGEARRLLANPAFKNYTIEAIAGEVGFGSKSVFNETFKRETGITPSVFQRNAISN